MTATPTDAAPKRRIDLSVGAFAPTLDEQMQEQGLSLDEHSLHHFELDRKAIGRLSVRGVLSEGETDKAAMRLLKRIGQKVKANPNSARGFSNVSECAGEIVPPPVSPAANSAGAE